MNEEITKWEELIKLRNNLFQHALNDVINNSGTKFNCKSDSFYLLQELVDMYSKGCFRVKEEEE